MKCSPSLQDKFKGAKEKITKFQITFTDQEQVIVAESSGALTAEAANLIDANSIGTDSWDFLTFINVWKGEELL